MDDADLKSLIARLADELRAHNLALRQAAGERIEAHAATARAASLLQEADTVTRSTVGFG